MKKGFTLIEIIVSITLIVIIGVGSFVGVRYITNKVRINKLNQITDKVIQAAEVYLESNSEARTHLYNNGEGVVIPIKLLVNEGLLTLENTDIKESDYEKEYVVTALGSTTQSEKCVTITTNASWNLNATTPLYICTDNNGNQNLKTVKKEEFSNTMTVLNEPYYFVGAGVSNWIKLKGKDNYFRILYVDTDDSLVLYNPYSNTFGNTFNEVTLPISSISTYYNYQYNFSCVNQGSSPIIKHNDYPSLVSADQNIHKFNGETVVTDYDLIKTSICTGVGGINRGETSYSELNTWMYYNGSYFPFGSSSSPVNRAKIHLKDCMKITGGTGDYANPYILENQCQST